MTTTTSLNVQTFDYKMYFFLLIVYSFSQFICTHDMRMNEQMKRKKWWIHQYCMLHVYCIFTCFWWCFVTNYTAYTANGERRFDFEFAYVSVNENNLSTTFMLPSSLSVCVCVRWLAAVTIPHQSQMIEKLINMKWCIKRKSKRLKTKRDKVRKIMKERNFIEFFALCRSVFLFYLMSRNARASMGLHLHSSKCYQIHN